MLDNTLINPYQGIDEEISVKATAVLSREDLSLIKGMYPYRGCVQLIVNLYLKAIADELRENNMLYYTPDNERKFIELIRRRTASATVGTKS